MVTVDSKTLVSICMATCLRADLFPESFQALLKQTYSPLEILVLADGANEESINILKNCNDTRVRWLSTTQPSGMVPAWNLICRESKGKYLLFCADDDVLLDEAIDRQVTLMEENDRVAFCHADFIFIDDSGKELNRWISHEGTWIKPGLEEWPRYIVRTGCCMQTTVIRRSMWDKVNGWDEDAGNPGDNSLYLKLLRVGDVGHVSHLACKYRIRTKTPDSWEKRFRNLQEYYQLAFKHLSSPPAKLNIPLKALERRLKRRLSRMSVPLLLSAPNKEMEAQLREWLSKNIWTGCDFGRFCQMLDWLGSLGLLESGIEFDLKLRDMARRLLRPMRKSSAA